MPEFVLMSGSYMFAGLCPLLRTRRSHTPWGDGTTFEGLLHITSFMYIPFIIVLKMMLQGLNVVLGRVDFYFSCPGW